MPVAAMAVARNAITAILVIAVVPGIPAAVRSRMVPVTRTVPAAVPSAIMVADPAGANGCTYPDCDHGALRRASLAYADVGISQGSVETRISTTVSWAR